jgi:hypothetical protein
VHPIAINDAKRKIALGRGGLLRGDDVPHMFYILATWKSSALMCRKRGGLF